MCDGCRVATELHHLRTRTAAPGLEGEAVERVRAWLAALEAACDFDKIHTECDQVLSKSDLHALLAAVDRLTGEVERQEAALRGAEGHVAALLDKIEDAQDRAFRAAFAPEGP